MVVNRIPLQHYVDMLARRETFALPQYGPFEFGWLVGGTFSTQEQVHLKWITEQLLETIKNNHGLPFYYGCQTQPPAPVQDITPNTFTFYDTSVFIKESLAGRLYPLIAELRQMRILYVGPDFLRFHKAGLFSPTGHVSVPDTNAYLMFDRICSDIKSKLLRGSGSKPYDLIGFSCGVLAPILIHQLWSENKDVSLMDFGALWDNYFGRISREYMNKLTPAICQSNLHAH